MSATVRRVARKAHRCDSCDEWRQIVAGDVYLQHTEFPGSPAGYATQAGHPIRHIECASCATRYGRAHLLEAA